jgi:hypothetical protein
MKATIAMACVLAGCGGIVEGSERDAGTDPSSGCYGTSQESCGTHVGRWCWSSPGNVIPMPGCMRANDGGLIVYWCCPPFTQ